MPLGLCNSLRNFMKLMILVLNPFTDIFVIVYFDDILIYNANKSVHLEHLKLLLLDLMEKKVYFNRKKCEFLITKLLLLGFTISKDGIFIDEKKVKEIS